MDATTTKLFRAEIDKLDAKNWTDLLAQFDDASIYQTWSYGAVRRGAGNVSHLVLKKDDEVLGCCQVTFRRLPFLNIGIAYIVWGPLWKRTGIQSEPDVFLHLIRELKK